MTREQKLKNFVKSRGNEHACQYVFTRIFLIIKHLRFVGEKVKKMRNCAEVVVGTTCFYVLKCVKTFQIRCFCAENGLKMAKNKCLHVYKSCENTTSLFR